METTTTLEPSIPHPPEANIARMVDEARQDPQKLGALYLLYVQPVYRYLYSRIGRKQEAEDLTAQTFLTMVERFPRYIHRGTFAAWLFSIARNKAMDYFRQQGRQTPLEDADALPDESANLLEQVIQSNRVTALSAQIAALPETQQELIRLRYLAGLSFAEMGQVLHKKEDTVKKSLYRVLARLKDQLEKDHV